jgi:A/G-specific adenine glycosylase
MVHKLPYPPKIIVPLIEVDRIRIRFARTALLRWAREHSRTFFWRKSLPTVFDLLVTEMLLSRTRASAVEPVALELLSRFPDPPQLARAEPHEVERILYPLGLHHKRAQQLIRCAAELVKKFEGDVPRDTKLLMTLPYVGRYAASAVMCFGYGARSAIVDSNVARVWRRFFSLPLSPMRLSNANELWNVAQELLPYRHVRQFNWAILDLGALICVPRKPKCRVCPLKRYCDAHKTGDCGCEHR